MEYIRDLTDVSKDDVRSAGSKGANLGELVQMGLPVPPGFVILTSAYQSFIEANTLQPEIERLTGRAYIDDPLSIERSSIALRNLSRMDKRLRLMAQEGWFTWIKVLRCQTNCQNKAWVIRQGKQTIYPNPGSGLCVIYL